MSRVTGKGYSDLDLANAFTVAGLANARVSVAKVENARIADKPVPWKLGGMGDDPFNPKTVELLARYMPATKLGDYHAREDGLRLVAPLGWRKSTDAIDGIVGLSGYQAAATVGGQEAFRSFTIDNSPFSLPNYLGLRGAPAVSWPMSLDAPGDLSQSLQKSRAVQRGFVQLSDAAGSGEPSVFADVVEFDGGGISGSYLALRFLSAGVTATRLPDHLSFASLDRSQPLVLLPLKGRAPEEVLTTFIYEMAHNSPIDVAAWDTVRRYGVQTQAAPVVLAPRNFLDHARLSDVIPGLQARLQRLSADSVLDVSPDDLLKFNPGAFEQIAQSRPTAEFVRDFLSKRNEYVWDRERDSAGGLLAIKRSIDALEREAPNRRRILPPLANVGWGKLVNSLPSPNLEGSLVGNLLDAIDLKTVLKGIVDTITTTSTVPTPSSSDRTAPPAGVGPPPPPERYTNVKIFDNGQPLKKEHPLVVTRAYIIDVSIGTKREGLSADTGGDQPQFILAQTAPANIWVVLTDETDRDGDPEDSAFTFDKRYDCFVLPLEGGSEGSAKFTITPKREAFAGVKRGRLGIRLYHKLNLIDHLELDLRVEASAGAVSTGKGDPAINVIFKQGTAPLERPDDASTMRALNISISKIGRGDQPDQDVYRFSFVMGDQDSSGRPVLFGTKKLPATVLNDYVARFRDILLDTAFGPSLTKVVLGVNDRDDLLKSLLLLGTTIVTQLFDYNRSQPTDFFQLGRMVREVLSDTSIIQISLSDGAEDFVFPWQILTLNHYTDRDMPAVPENLWGYRFIIEVKRRGDGQDNRLPTARARTPLRVTYGRWNFSNEKEHHKRLQEIVDAASTTSRLVDPVVDTQQDFLAALKSGGGDLVYVYAHGHAATPSTPAGVRVRDKARQQIEQLALKIQSNPTGLSTEEFEEQKKILEQFRKVTADGADSLLTFALSGITLTGLLVEMPPGGQRLGDAPIVILNTCESAQVWNAVEGSFIGFFLDRGARAVLGSETTIPVVLADVFGRAVLEAMFQGNSLGNAVYLARRSLLEDNKNPLGLCYSVYGAADARLFSPSSQASTGRPLQ